MARPKKNKRRWSDSVEATFDKEKIYVQTSGTPRYYKKMTKTNLGFNILENLMLVRYYIQKRHDISFRDLEFLLFLYPKLFWDIRDYRDYPKTYSHRNINTMIKKGYVEVFTETDRKRKTVYQLTKKAKHIVVQFYKYLSGEKNVPENTSLNSMFKADATSTNRKRADWVRKINAQILENPPEDFEAGWGK